jgi:hypothetical protein
MKSTIILHKHTRISIYKSVRIFFSEKENPLLDEVESLNLADLQMDNSNQREKSETLRILMGRSEMEDGIFFCIFIQKS